MHYTAEFSRLRPRYELAQEVWEFKPMKTKYGDKQYLLLQPAR